ncbi:MAG: hypothetical protein AAF939_10780 [Planctomycetota bacterium]
MDFSWENEAVIRTVLMHDATGNLEPSISVEVVGPKALFDIFTSEIFIAELELSKEQAKKYRKICKNWETIFVTPRKTE